MGMPEIKVHNRDGLKGALKIETKMSQFAPEVMKTPVVSATARKLQGISPGQSLRDIKGVTPTS